MDNALNLIARHADAGVALRTAFFATQAGRVAEAARHMAVSLARGGKILLAGNGGSAADAQHWAGEFVNRFVLDRPPLPAIALTTDTSVLTAIGNDFGYERVFARQIEALGRPGDVFVAISTSGNSANLIEALHTARRQQLFCIGLTGRGGQMDGLCDILLSVPVQLLAVKTGAVSETAPKARTTELPQGKAAGTPPVPGLAEKRESADDGAGSDFMLTPLIQEVHAAIGHLLCALVDQYLFEDVMAIKPFLNK